MKSQILCCCCLFLFLESLPVWLQCFQIRRLKSLLQTNLALWSRINHCFIQVWLKEFLSFQTLWVKAINLSSICLWVLILFNDLDRPVFFIFFCPQLDCFFLVPESNRTTAIRCSPKFGQLVCPTKMCLCVLHCFTCRNPFYCKGLNHLLCRAYTLQLKVAGFQENISLSAF